jgi:hypothetical protein
MIKNLFPLALALLLFSCSGQAEGVIRQSGAAELTLDISLGARTAALIRGFSAMAGADDGAEVPILDGPVIAGSIAAAPGVLGAVLINRGPEAVNGTISLSRIDEFLSLPLAGGNSGEPPFIVWDEAGLLVFNLNRNTSPMLLSLLSPDVTEMLSALMAPCATGEIISKAEYLTLVGSIYGRAVADEIGAARIRLILTLPGPVTVASGAFQGRQARFEIPLLDLLTLDSPLSYEVRWRG